MININKVKELAERLSDSESAQYRIEMRQGKWAIVITETESKELDDEQYAFDFGGISIPKIEYKTETVYYLEG